MKFNSVFDISSIIWEKEEFDANSHKYYELLLGVLSLFEKFIDERPSVLLRKELSYEMMCAFPFEQIKNFGKIQ